MTLEGTVIRGPEFEPVEGRVVVEPGRDAKLLVLDGDSDTLTGARAVVRAVVRRAGVGDVRDVVL